WLLSLVDRVEQARAHRAGLQAHAEQKHDGDLTPVRRQSKRLAMASPDRPGSPVPLPVSHHRPAASSSSTATTSIASSPPVSSASSSSRSSNSRRRREDSQSQEEEQEQDDDNGMDDDD